MSDLGGSTSPGSGDAGRSGPSAPASSAASIGPASALPSYHKKKRFHGVTAARRAGHGVPGNSSSGTFGDGEDDAEGDVAEGAFISSSRDASEVSLLIRWHKIHTQYHHPGLLLTACAIHARVRRITMKRLASPTVRHRSANTRRTRLLPPTRFLQRRATEPSSTRSRRIAGPRG